MKTTAILAALQTIYAPGHNFSGVLVVVRKLVLPEVDAVDVAERWPAIG